MRDRTKNSIEPKTLLEAISIVQNACRFNESIDLDIGLGINVKKNESIRGSFELPYGTSKNIKIAVIADTERVQEAKEMGIEVVGGEDLIEQILKDGISADICLCSVDMFPKIKKIAKILGPLKLMPNTKDGTVTNDIKKSIQALISGKTRTIRNDSAGHIRLSVGKSSFSSEEIAENIRCCIEFIKEKKPEKTKHLFSKNFFISSTQGISVSCKIGIR